jgi:hypothetical protein
LFYFKVFKPVIKEWHNAKLNLSTSLINSCRDNKQPDTQNCEEVLKKEETKEGVLTL